MDASTMFNLLRHSREEEIAVGIALNLNKVLVPSRVESCGEVVSFGPLNAAALGAIWLVGSGNTEFVS